MSELPLLGKMKPLHKVKENVHKEPQETTHFKANKPELWISIDNDLLNRGKWLFVVTDIHVCNTFYKTTEMKYKSMQLNPSYYEQKTVEFEH